MRATIKALNFFPYWRVPESVATLDLIPRLMKEPDYLQKEQIRVLTGSFNGPEIDPHNIDWRQADATKIKFRQDPGPQNALGLVRLDMPNEHGVYMHDTPMKPLFNQRGRAFSAGCVRVQDVFTLAEWLARYEPGWEQPGRAQEILQSSQAVDLNLTRPVPVYFAYITAWAEPDGRIYFRPDIYGRDGLQDLVAGHERDPERGPRAAVDAGALGSVVIPYCDTCWGAPRRPVVRRRSPCPHWVPFGRTPEPGRVEVDPLPNSPKSA